MPVFPNQANLATNRLRLFWFLAPILWAVSVGGQQPAPADPALAGLYRRIHFEQLYPPEAVTYLQDQLQSAPRAVKKLDELAKDERPEVRGLVALLLGELGDPQGVDALWRLTRDEKEAVRHIAAGGLVRLSRLKPVTISTQGLTDERAAVRRSTATVLGDLRDKTAEPALVAALQDPDELARADVVRALASEMCGTSSSLPYLVETLNDPSVEVRGRAVHSVASYDHPLVVDPLLRRLDDPDWHIRAGAALALQYWVRRDTAVVPVLIDKLVNDSHALVRDRAADSLTLADNDEAIAALVQAVVGAEQGARGHATRALIVSKCTRALPLLMPHYCDADPEVRMRLMEIFGEIGGQAQLPAITENLTDEDLGVRLAAVKALRRMKVAGLTAGLLQKLEDQNAHVRAQAATVLGQLDDRSAVTNLIKALRDENSFVRAAAAEAVGQLGDRTAVASLVSVLTNQSAGAVTNGLAGEAAEATTTQLKIKVVQALGAIRSEDGADPIILHGLTSPDPGLRAESAVALGKMRVRRAVGPLQNMMAAYYAAPPSETKAAVSGTATNAVTDAVQLMKDNEARVRASVIWALGQIGDPAARPVLVKAFDDANSLVRDAATEALARIADQEEREAAAAAVVKPAPKKKP
jgi:HEAT repeat protein